MPSANIVKLTESAKVLIVDDNKDLIRLMILRLKPMKFEIKTAESAEEALITLATWTPNLVITDLQMPGMSGMDLFDKIHAENPLIPVIILTAHGTIPDAIAATQSGVSSFLTKPFDSRELLLEVSSALVNSGFENQGNNSKVFILNDHWHKNVISKSPKIENLFNQLVRFATTDNLLLFSGEAGSGKSILAKAAHDHSHRCNSPFASLSCKSLPERLLNLELYGKVGSGTLENPEQMGILRNSHGGSFVLHDFEKASPAFLHTIMSSLINKKIRPVDSDTAINIDIRPMTTTIGAGGYSQNGQLAWGLGGKMEMTPFRVPPLRERREDITLIANATLAELTDKSDLQFSNKAMQVLLAADWPGNLRQLRNTVRQCARLCNTKIISESLVESRLNKSRFKMQTLSSAHLDFERKYLIEVLKATNGNVTKSSELAERNRTEFHRLLKKHKIEASQFRQ